MNNARMRISKAHHWRWWHVGFSDLGCDVCAGRMCSCNSASSTDTPVFSPTYVQVIGQVYYSRPLHFAVVVVQLLSHVWLFETPWTAARQASLSFTISWSSLKLMSMESVMPSNHSSRRPLLLLPSIFPNIRVFSNELALPIRWPKYWSFRFSISPSHEYRFPLGLTGLISLESKGLSRVFSHFSYCFFPLRGWKYNGINDNSWECGSS